MGCGAGKGAQYVTDVAPLDGEAPAPKRASPKKEALPDITQEDDGEKDEFAEQCLVTVGKVLTTATELANRVNQEIVKMDDKLFQIRQKEEVKNMNRRVSGMGVMIAGKEHVAKDTIVGDDGEVTIVAVNPDGEDVKQSWAEVSMVLGGATIKDDVQTTARGKTRKFASAYVIAQSPAGEDKMLAVEVGDRVDVVHRHHGGWTYCRKGDAEGWVPQASLEERAKLRLDVVAEDDSQLSGKAGDMFVVNVRHYTGWSFCVASESKKEGWIADHHLMDLSAEEDPMEDKEGLIFALTIKRYGQVMEALQRVMESCEKAKTNFEWMRQNSKDLGLRAELQEDGLNGALQTLVEGLSDEIVAISEVLYATEPVNMKATVKWMWDKQEGALVVPEGGVVEVLTRKVDNTEWSWAVYKGDEGWIPDQALDYSCTDGGTARSKESGEEGTSTREHKRKSSKRKSRDVPHHALEDLPKWVKVKAYAWWWSTSQEQHLAVKITNVDADTQLITVNFHCNPSSWKAVYFDDVLGENARSCLLQPPQDMADEEEEVLQNIEGVADSIKEMFGDVEDGSTLFASELGGDEYVSSDSDSEGTKSVPAVVKFATASRPITPCLTPGRQESKDLPHFGNTLTVPTGAFGSVAAADQSAETSAESEAVPSAAGEGTAESGTAAAEAEPASGEPGEPKSPATAAEPASPAAAVVKGSEPKSPAAAVEKGSEPKSPAAAPVEGAEPTSPTAAPVEGAEPKSPAATPAEGAEPISPAPAPVEGAESVAPPSESTSPVASPAKDGVAPTTHPASTTATPRLASAPAGEVEAATPIATSAEAQPQGAPCSPQLTADFLMLPTDGSRLAQERNAEAVAEYERKFVDPVELDEERAATRVQKYVRGSKERGSFLQKRVMCVRIQARIRGMAGRRKMAHKRLERSKCITIASVMRSFLCKRTLRACHQSLMATRIQSRQRAIVAKKRTGKIRQQREDEKLEKIFQQLSQATPALELIEKLELLEEKRNIKGENNDADRSRARVATACAAAAVVEEAQYDAAFAMKLRTLEEDLERREMERLKSLEERLRARTEVTTALEGDVGAIAAWHEREVEVCKREFPSLLEIQKDELLQRKDRIKAQFQLSTALQSGSEKEVEDARSAILASSTMVLTAERLSSLSSEDGLAKVAAWARMLPEETQWCRGQKDRQTRNELFVNRLSELLGALEQRLEAERVWVEDNEAKAEEGGWDSDMVVTTMTRNERITRSQFVAQQQFAKERKIDKDMEGVVERCMKDSAADVRHACEHVGARLERRFGPRATELVEALSPLSERVINIDDAYDEEVAAKGKEADEEVAKMEDEKRTKHSVNKQMHDTAVSLMLVKRRVEVAKLPSGKYKRLPLKRALKIIKKLKQKLKDFEVDTQNKQKASVLLHSIRMIETHLRKELGDVSDKNAEKDDESDDENVEKDKDANFETPQIRKKIDEWDKTDANFEKMLEAEKERLRSTLMSESVREAKLKKCQEQKKAHDLFAPFVKEADILVLRCEEERCRLLDGIRLYPITALVHSACNVEHQRLTSRREKNLPLGKFGYPRALEKVRELKEEVSKCADAELPFKLPANFEDIINGRLERLRDSGQTMIEELRLGAESVGEYEQREPSKEPGDTESPKAKDRPPPLGQPPTSNPTQAPPKKPREESRRGSGSKERSSYTAPPRRTSLAGSNSKQLLNELDNRLNTLDNLMKKTGGLSNVKSAPPPKAVPSSGPKKKAASIETG